MTTDSANHDIAQTLESVVEQAVSELRQIEDGSFRGTGENVKRIRLMLNTALHLSRNGGDSNAR